MFKILGVGDRRIKACAVMVYKGYEISVSTVFEDNIAVFLDQDENKQEYYQDKDGNKMTNLEQAIELVESLIKIHKIRLISYDNLNGIGDYDNCKTCPYYDNSTLCSKRFDCVGGYFRRVIK